jgi:hypothetical protein
MSLWLVSATLGAVFAIAMDFGGPVVLVPIAGVVLVGGRRAPVIASGLQVGFGGTFLLLLAQAQASGGELQEPVVWLLVGIVPATLGLLMAVVLLIRRRRPESRQPAGNG